MKCGDVEILSSVRKRYWRIGHFTNEEIIVMQEKEIRYYREQLEGLRKTSAGESENIGVHKD